MSALTDKLEFAIVLGEELSAQHYGIPVRAAALADALMAKAKRYHCLCECQCNGGSTEDLARWAKEQARIKKRVADLLEPYGIKPIFQGDPRGAVLKLQLPRTKITNGWGGEGYCVPQ